MRRRKGRCGGRRGIGRSRRAGGRSADTHRRRVAEVGRRRRRAPWRIGGLPGLLRLRRLLWIVSARECVGWRGAPLRRLIGRHRLRRFAWRMWRGALWFRISWPEWRALNILVSLVAHVACSRLVARRFQQPLNRSSGLPAQADRIVPQTPSTSRDDPARMGYPAAD
jgi:hypothetical protein